MSHYTELYYKGGCIRVYGEVTAESKERAHRKKIDDWYLTICGGQVAFKRIMEGVRYVKEEI